MYQVGLMESDSHVQYFWSALESFSQVSVIALFKWSRMTLVSVS